MADGTEPAPKPPVSNAPRIGDSGCVVYFLLGDIQDRGGR